MSTAIHEPTGARTTRLSVLVSDTEAEQITKQAEASGLSVSAFLRERALGLKNSREEEEALRQVDALIDKMAGDVESAIGQVASTLARLTDRPNQQ